MTSSNRGPEATKEFDAIEIPLVRTPSHSKGLTRWLRQFGLVVILLPFSSAWAGLGDFENAVHTDKVRMQASHSVTAMPRYSVHDLHNMDGAHIRQYVGSDGRVFAVAWRTLYKPDLSSLLGSSYPTFAQSARGSAHKVGIQRRFRHEGLDVVVQSTAHLNIFSGYAYRQSMLPAGFSPSAVGLK